MVAPPGSAKGVWLQGLEGPAVISITSVAGGLCAHPSPGPCYSSRGTFGLPARPTEQQALPPWAPGPACQATALCCSTSRPVPRGFLCGCWLTVGLLTSRTWVWGVQPVCRIGMLRIPAAWEENKYPAKGALPMSPIL